MEEIVATLKDIHKDIKSERPKGNKLSGNAAYRNGYEDGYKVVTKRIKIFIEMLQSKSPDESQNATVIAVKKQPRAT